MLDEYVKWFVSTCHPCQTQKTHHLHLPPTIPNIPTLLCKVHIDTMLMPTVNKFWYLIQACCVLSSWAKGHPFGRKMRRHMATLYLRISSASGVVWQK